MTGGRRLMQSRRTVLGVTLRRSAPDIWTVGGWSFQAAEGCYVGWGRMEWRAYDPAGVMSIHASLAGAVKAMLLQTGARS